MELLDVYDSLGNKTGRVVERGNKNEMFRDDEHIGVAIIFIENDKGEFLIQKTSKEKGGLYSSTGGHIHHDEDALSTILREVKEELGIDISQDNVIHLGHICVDFPVRFMFYLKKSIDINQITLQKEEVESISYMSVEEIKDAFDKELMLKGHYIVFEKVLEYIKKEENIIIRKAETNDIEEIANIKVNGWKTAYDGMIDSEILDTMDINKEIDSYTNHYSLDNVFVAESNDEILGFCRVYDYDNSPYEDKEIDCEIREIYVRPDIKRMGIGSKIFHYILNYFKQKGKMKLYLGVLEDNDKSRNFYEKMGGILGKKDSLTIKGKSYSTISYTYNLK